MKSPSCGPPFTVALATALLTALSVPAQTFDIGASVSFPGVSPPADRILHAGSVGVDIVWTAYGSASAVASATGAPGILRAVTTADATAPTPTFAFDETFAASQASAWVYYGDTLTISASDPGLAGRPGTAVASLLVPSSMAAYTQLGNNYAGAGGANRAGGNVTLQGGFGNGGFVFTGAVGVASGSPSSIPTSLEMPFDFNFGVPFHIEVDLSLDVNAGAAVARGTSRPGGSNYSFVDLDFGQSVYFDGIGLITHDGVGLVPGSYSVTSTSGVDYSQSFVPSTVIPESSTWIAAAAILGAGAIVVRRRRCRGTTAS